MKLDSKQNLNGGNMRLTGCMLCAGVCLDLCSHGCTGPCTSACRLACTAVLSYSRPDK